MDKYRLIAGVHVDKDNKRHSNNAIVATDSPLNELFKGQFIKLDENAPEPMPEKGDKLSNSKSYDVTGKFKLAMNINLTVSKKGKLYFVSNLHDTECKPFNTTDLESADAVNEFISNYSN